MQAENSSLPYAKKELMRRLNGPASTVAKYCELRFLLPTSNVCERLFWKVGHVFNDRCRSFNPANLESKIFLHANGDMLGVSDLTNRLASST